MSPNCKGGGLFACNSPDNDFGISRVFCSIKIDALRLQHIYCWSRFCTISR